MPSEWDILDSLSESCDVCDPLAAAGTHSEHLCAQATQRVLDALVGGLSVPVGASFLPQPALSGLRWNVPHDMPRMLAALVEQAHLDFVFIPGWEPWADEAVDRVAAAGAATLWVVPGPLGILAERDGWSETLRRTARDTEMLQRDMRAELPQLVERVRRGARLKATAIVVAEDLAGAQGLLVSPDYAFDAIFPLLQETVSVATEETLLSIWHSDGDTRSLLAAARRAGFIGVHPGGLTTPDFMRLYDCARSTDLAVLGGINGESIRAGGPTALDAGSAAMTLATHGGLLVSDDGGMSTTSEVAELLTALGEAQRTRRDKGGL